MGAKSETSPAEKEENLVQGRRRQIHRVAPGRDGARRSYECGELFTGLLRPPLELLVLPVKPCVAGLHCAVPFVVEAPVEIVTGVLVPVALPEGVREAATDCSRCVDSDQVSAPPRSLDLVRDVTGIWQITSIAARRALHVHPVARDGPR